MKPNLLVMILLTASFSVATYGAGLQITSPAFQNNGAIPEKYTCDAKSVSPPLQFSGVPAKAQSLVLIVDDPDVPKNTIRSVFMFSETPDFLAMIRLHWVEGARAGGFNRWQLTPRSTKPFRAKK